MLREPKVLQRIGDEETEIRREAESILKELGFSSYAAQAFVAVSSDTPVAAGELCRKTKVPDSKIYYALKEIEDVGLITRISGTPQLYSAQGPKEVSEILRRLARLKFEKQESIISRLEKILKPISKTSGNREGLEIAYIARGLENAVRRLSKMLDSASSEVLGYVWDEEIYSAVSEDLSKAVEREVKVRLALNPKFAQKKNGYLPVIHKTKVLSCQCNLFVVDKTKMISITRTKANSHYAIITEDPGMISLGISYYDNPACCFN